MVGLISDKEVAGYNDEYKYSVTHKVAWLNNASKNEQRIYLAYILGCRMWW